MSIIDDRIIKPLSSSIAVTTLQVLMPWTTFGEKLASLMLIGINLDGTHPATFFFETSEDQAHQDGLLDGGELAPKLAQPGRQVSLEVGQFPLRTFWRISCFSSDPGNPSINVQWMVKGMHRSGAL